MPNTAVVDTRIFWSATTSNGQYLYCWETVTDTPCSYQHRLNSRPRIDVNPSRTENRGGGTIALNNQIYVFTDDHRVHCIRPDSFSTCSGFGANGLPTALGSGHANFPWADGYNRNHGSSIDRIVDEDTGYIYSTLHIDSIERGPNNIQPPPVCDDPGLGNREDPTGIITIKNVSTASANIYVRLNPTDPEHVMDFVADPNNPPDLYTRWEVVRAEAPDHTDVDPRYVYAFRNVGYWEEQGASMFLNVELPDAEGIIGLGSEFTTNPTIDQLYRLEYQGTSSRMRSFGYDTFDDNYIRDDGGEYVMADYVNQTADWIFEPWQCSWNGPQGLQFSVGTFLHCFDTINAAPCSDFKPSKIHDDSDSFSGRPFFYYGGGNNPAKLGICSTGFTEQWSWRDMRGLTQMTCVDMQGEDAPGFENAMSTFTSALNSTNFQGWGTWGDPHYSEHANRILYPTQRAKSRVLCYDFDTASYCGAREGVSALGYVQDYGFFSQGNCVYGLGHNAIFWAFQAENIFEDCTGSSTETTINPCNCSGSLYWGTLNFDVDLELFDSFLIEVYNAEGVRIVPPEDALNDEGDPSEGWSLHDDGTVLDLNGLPVLSEDDELTIEVEVISESDPWAMGDQTFEISFERTPKLTD